MADDASEALEKLETASRQIEALVTEIAQRSGGFDDGTAHRISLVRARLTLASDALGATDAGGDSITDE